MVAIAFYGKLAIAAGTGATVEIISYWPTTPSAARVSQMCGPPPLATAGAASVASLDGRMPPSIASSHTKLNTRRFAVVWPGSLANACMYRLSGCCCPSPDGRLNAAIQGSGPHEVKYKTCCRCVCVCGPAPLANACMYKLLGFVALPVAKLDGRPTAVICIRPHEVKYKMFRRCVARLARQCVHVQALGV